MNRPISEATNNITEQDLIALQFNELTPQRARAVRRALNDNPELAAEAEALTTMFARMKGVEIPSDSGLLDRNWRALRPSLAAHALPMPRMARWQKPAFAGLVLASAATVGYVLSQRIVFSGSKTPVATVTPEIKSGQAQTEQARLRQEPGSTADPLRAPSGAGWKVRLDAGVYHPKAGKTDSPVQMLGLATTARGLETIPVRPRFSDAGQVGLPLGSRSEIAARGTGPLTEAPVGAHPLSMEPAWKADAQAMKAADAGQSGAATSIASGHKPATRRGSRIETTLSLGAAGQFTAQRAARNQNGDDIGYQSMNKADAVLATVGQSFKPWLGYTVNFGYARSIEDNVGYEGVPGENFPIAVNAYELSVAYTVRKRLRPKLTAFANVGGGALTFLPVHRGSTAKDYVPYQTQANVPPVNFRPLGVATVGAEYHVMPRVGLRVEYRGLLYKMPDFGELVGKSLTLTSGPTVSVTYRFGGGL